MAGHLHFQMHNEGYEQTDGDTVVGQNQVPKFSTRGWLLPRAMARMTLRTSFLVRTMAGATRKR